MPIHVRAEETGVGVVLTGILMATDAERLYGHIKGLGKSCTLESPGIGAFYRVFVVGASLADVLDLLRGTDFELVGG
jgi:hypothetical protein